MVVVHCLEPLTAPLCLVIGGVDVEMVSIRRRKLIGRPTGILNLNLYILPNGNLSFKLNEKWWFCAGEVNIYWFCVLDFVYVDFLTKISNNLFDIIELFLPPLLSS
jgi:hypothetical protein